MVDTNQTKKTSSAEPETVLELYDRAYEFQYERKNPAAAAKIYKEIIREFPSSNECAYAAIQLEKMAAGKVLKKLRADTKPKVPGWIIFLLVLNIIATLLFSAAFVIYVSGDIEALIPALGKTRTNTSISDPTFCKREKRDSPPSSDTLSRKHGCAANPCGLV